MSKRLLTALALVAGATALSGCVVAPYPGYGYGYGYGYGGYRQAPPAAVIVTPRPYYGYRGWRNDPYR